MFAQHYAWDSLDNLATRIDDNGDGTSGPVNETFTYADGLNHLTGYSVSTPGVPGLKRSVTLQYNALGMLPYKSDVGNYSYPTKGASIQHFAECPSVPYRERATDSPPVPSSREAWPLPRPFWQTPTGRSAPAGATAPPALR